MVDEEEVVMFTSTKEETFEGQNNENFICGVVEGFYGRPWTTDQRKDLFRKLRLWGLNSYVYAPKDDYKHRAYWRELYTVEEADHLTGLISAAKEQNIIFYYALSPGLDITYSSTKELTTLKRKLEQVSQFGCEAFALLFDDIESEMSKSDKEVFQSFAQAQVSVTNEIFSHLNNPKFLFCPTQYCSSRAIPTVAQSEYLNTIGSKLDKEINVLWTGQKVISKWLTIESIQEITDVLQRPPVIWDNLHANDYDQKRVFLGPYSGRSPELKPLLKGVLSNPNCEFHANTIGIHTLAHWSKCSSDVPINISADIKLETENEEGIIEDAPIYASKNIYHPRIALRNAISDWLPEFFIRKEAFGPITKPHPPVTIIVPIIPIIPSVNTCMSLTTTTTTSTTTAQMSVPEVNTTQLQAFADVCSTVVTEPLPPLANIIMNSLVSPTKVVTNDLIRNPIVTNVNQTMTMPEKIPVSSLAIPIMGLKQDGQPTESKPSGCDDDEGTEDDSGGGSVDAGRGNGGRNCDVTDDDNELDINKIEEDISSSHEILTSGTLNLDLSNKNHHDDEHEPMKEEVRNLVGSNSGGGEKMNISEDQPSPGSFSEPMECGGNSLISLNSPKHAAKLLEDVNMSENNSTCSAGSMQVEVSEAVIGNNSDQMIEDDDRSLEKDINVDDLNLLCDLFYLPFEHGHKGMQILNEFYWLKSNASLLVNCSKKSLEMKPEVQEWFRRSEKFMKLCQCVIILGKKLATCVNKELSYDLYSYIWDIASVISLLMAFVKWLSLGHFPQNINSYIQGSFTWFTKGWKETFSSGDQEPWVFHGGLIADLQRLIPVDSGNDLFLYKLPEIPTSNFYSFRPYNHLDETDVNTICHQTCRDGSDCTELFPVDFQDIPADRLVGPFLTITPELCVIAENVNGKIVGYACAALDAKVFYRNQEMCWFPAMCQKYPISLLDSPELTQTAKDAVNHFHNFKYEGPPDVLNTHPSIMTCSVLKHQVEADESVSKRLVTILLAALRSNGSFGVHVCINITDRFVHQFYTKLGFQEVFQDTINSRVYLGRNF